ncbi:hypothetical protein B9T36_09790 [Acinetobacter sp. ANC 4204]|uniref:DUF1281 family ferredoxin-like fold protein n=1 Tax=Acinetobacter sp. ANC 4204 TaxID=1977884 RepID=UPI000A34BD78|nr:hypothetical protein [Acinetobacter sp. ANC 4204]OTG58638.1 hypothetical protein B9T36_09790 [Acinetobacter sp. ANC 4204]
MPNHVSNKIEITSTNAADALNYMRANEREFDFNKIIPMPESLNVESGSRTDAALAYALSEGFKSELTADQIEKYFEDGFFTTKEAVAQRDLATAQRLIDDNSETAENLLKLGQQIISNVDTYGAKTWYQWAIPNWGTKWNAYDVKVEEAQVTFDTAWNSPLVVLDAWISQFKLSCTVKAFDEGHNFWFIRTYKDGVLESERDTLKEDCNSLCKELKGYDPSEEDED